MNLKTQKATSAAIVGVTVFFCLEVLAYMLNLNQVGGFVHLAFWVWLYLAVLMAFLYDLHFKNSGSFSRAAVRHGHMKAWLKRYAKIILSAFWDRIEHFRRWSHFKHWQNYLLLPGLLFWSTITMLYLNFGNVKTQQVLVALSGTFLILIFWYLKEAFHRRKEVVDSDIFVGLSVAKIYTAGMLFGAGLGLMRQNCLSPYLYGGLVFALVFLLIYQALFQHRLIKLSTLGCTLIISLVMAIAGFLVYIYWGYNIYTAAIFLTVIYNLLWGIFHYYLDRSLTKRAFWEIATVSLLIAIMVLSVTNFKAKILGGC